MSVFSKKIKELFFLLLCCATVSANVLCRDPMFDIDNKPHSHRKFVLLSCPVNGGGIGNQLVFYPAQYFYAILTGRDIVIHDKGLFGELCSVITCGFPLLSQIKGVYPDTFSDHSMGHIRVMKPYDMIRQFMDQSDVENEIVVGSGVIRKSDWWLWMNGTTECIQRVTSCAYSDVACSEKYAFQSLIKGPFRSVVTAHEEQRIKGIPQQMRHGIMTLPRAICPRIEVAVHMRAQFRHFENQVHSNDTEAKTEVDTWLNSTQGVQVFQRIEEKVVQELEKLGFNSTSGGHAYVYVAADNEEIKDAFITKLEENHPFIKAMRVETSGVMHVKNLDVAKTVSAGEAGFDMAFDWYALSLSKVILAWRRDSGMRSTFVQTASYVSGHVGYFLSQDRHGNWRWDGL